MIKTNDFRLTQKELKTAYYGIQRNYEKKLKPWILIGNFLYFLSFVIFALFNVVYLGINYQHMLILLIFVILPMFILIYGGYYLGLELYFHILFKKEPLYQSSSFVEINDDFISQTYEDGSFFKFNLNFIKSVLKKEDVCVFIIENQTAIFFPIRAFNSEEDVKVLENHLKKKS